MTESVQMVDRGADPICNQVTTWVDSEALVVLGKRRAWFGPREWPLFGRVHPTLHVGQDWDQVIEVRDTAIRHAVDPDLTGEFRQQDSRGNPSVHLYGVQVACHGAKPVPRGAPHRLHSGP